MGARPQRWTAERVNERLQKLELPRATPEGSTQPTAWWSYVDAASVLSSFDPRTLKPVRDDSPRREALQQLRAHSLAMYEPNGRVSWRLEAPIRREALRRMGSPEAILAACQLNRAETEDPLAQTILGLVTGTGKAIEEQTRSELSQTLEVSEWLDGIVDELPDTAVVRRALDRASVLEPLLALVGTHFSGREKELARLREYVGVLPPGSPIRSLRRVTRTMLGRDDRVPLVVLGVGGIGKSTLLAKFILDHAKQADAHSIAFAYLDFDRPSVSAAEPISILLEAARQLAVQCEERYRHTWETLHISWAARLVDEQRAPKGSRAKTRGAPSGKPENRIIDEFTRELERSFGPTVPFLLVLDTFEEVQYRSREFVRALWAVLDRLGERLPMLRTVLAGRAPIEGHKTEQLELGMLDRKAASGFLDAQGVTDPEIAGLIVSRLGCSPLTLSLAADLMRREGAGAEAIREVTRRQHPFIFALERETAEVMLYRRVLRHIHDPALRKLAHPGLALRRITPQLIRWVLAGPCGLKVDSDAEARQLFRGLRTEITLVRATEDGALEHRTDVRRAMLPMLRATEPRAFAAINQAAIDYLSQSETVTDRAEEIYHRLAACQDPVDVDKRWLPGVEDHLRNAIDELSPRAQAYLAARVGVELDPKIWQNASREDVERRTEQRAREHLILGHPEEALSVLHEVTDRAPGSKLYLLEAHAYRDTGDPDSALDVAYEATQPGAARETSFTTLDLLVLAADIELARDERDEACAWIDDAYSLVSQLDSDVRLLETGARRLQIWRARQRDDAERASEVAAEIHRDLGALDTDVLAARRSAAHVLAGELGATYPAEIVRIAEAVGLPQLRPERIRLSIKLWNQELRGRLDEDVGARAILRSPEPPSPGNAMEILLGLLGRSTLTPRAATMIASEIREVIARAETDRRPS
jgi:hypothetical protein